MNCKECGYVENDYYSHVCPGCGSNTHKEKNDFSCELCMLAMTRNDFIELAHNYEKVASLPTVDQGHFCDIKIKTQKFILGIVRGEESEVVLEELVNGRWNTVELNVEDCEWNRVKGEHKLEDYNNENYRQFAIDCANAGLEIRHYSGRHGYSGPAVTVDDIGEGVVSISRATQSINRLQWDNMGLRYIVYPG